MKNRAANYYLHASFYTPMGLNEAPELNVVCVLIKNWRIVDYGPLAASQKVLRVTSWMGAMRKTERTMDGIYDLKPGNRFYVVDNNPREVQRPNGPIIWSWDERGEIDSRVQAPPPIKALKPL